MTTKTVMGSCDICKTPIEGKNQRTYNQVLGFHKAVKHDIHQDKRKQARLYYYRKKGFSPAEVEAREAKYKAMERAVATNNDQPAQGTGFVPYAKRVKSPEAAPVALKECPYCKSRFFGIKGDA